MMTGARRNSIPLFLVVVLLAIAPALALAQGAGAQAANPPASTSASATQPTSPVITFLKIFKSSSPEYVQIKIDRSGAGTYDIRQLADPSKPEPFQVSPAVTARIFSLAAALHDFQGIHLEAQRRIANLGEKTFRYQKGDDDYQVSFNFTLNSDASHLLQIFEGLSLQDQFIDQLRSSMRYDPLGLNDVLNQLQDSLASRMLADPDSLLPILDQIAANHSLLDLVRAHATQMAASISRHRR